MPNPEKPYPSIVVPAQAGESEPGSSASAGEGSTLDENMEATRTRIGKTVDVPDGRPVVGPQPLRQGIYVGGSPYWEPGTEPRRTRG